MEDFHDTMICSDFKHTFNVIRLTTIFIEIVLHPNVVLEKYPFLITLGVKIRLFF